MMGHRMNDDQFSRRKIDINLNNKMVVFSKPHMAVLALVDTSVLHWTGTQQRSHRTVVHSSRNRDHHNNGRSNVMEQVDYMPMELTILCYICRNETWQEISAR
jgi:hypothetical protein